MSELNINIAAIDQAEQFADAYEARKAVGESSYGVGGLLIDYRIPKIIHTMHNTVIASDGNGDKPRLKDPTAHGERQLVDWYFENRNAMRLPDPKDLLIVTTLDPCCMCCGSLLAAGFHVAVAALDSKAGINFDGSGTFGPLEGDLLRLIQDRFWYPAVKGVTSAIERGEQGVGPGGYNRQALSSGTVSGCSDTFDSGAKKARDIVNGAEVPVNDLLDIQRQDPESAIAKQAIAALKSAYSGALQYRAPFSAQLQRPVPDAGLAPFLQEAITEDRRSGGDGDAVAFLDHFGNLMMVMPGKRSLSPIRTALMETLRAYQRVRYELTRSNQDVLKLLHDPKHGTFVMARGFDKSAPSFADLGAYGSAILGTLHDPLNLQYVLPRIPHQDLLHYIGRMPPRYVNLIKPSQVADAELIKALSSL